MDVLTKEDKDAILQALKDCETLRNEIQKAKRAGIDVTDIENRLREAELALNNLKRVYIPSK